VGDNIHKYVSEAGEPEIDEAQLESQRSITLAPLSVKEGTEPMELECAIRYICESYGGMFKSEGYLREGLRRLDTLRRVFIPNLMATNPHYLMRCLEVRNILDMAELHLQASLARNETRDTYVRLDCPQKNPKLENKRMCQRLEKGKAVVEAIEAPVLKPEYAGGKK
jgi:succinate dehydrogenase/fumarate reductase flavoprotein subunit